MRVGDAGCVHTGLCYHKPSDHQKGNGVSEQHRTKRRDLGVNKRRPSFPQQSYMQRLNVKAETIYRVLNLRDVLSCVNCKRDVHIGAKMLDI